jgi:hypothetical protein
VTHEPSDEAPPGLSPSFLARYTVRACVGRGGMGAVYHAEQASTGKAVAVKFLLGEDDPGSLDRFAREARLLAKVAHPGVLRALDFGVEDGKPYLVTELLPGPTLRARIREAGKLGPTATVELARELLDALEACHQAGIVHRDLKPDNVMFDGEGRPRIMDLGIARPLTDETKLTRSGSMLGTPSYMPPEQAKGEQAGPAADIYAFGCMLFEMLSGTPPYQAATLGEMIAKHIAAPVPSLEVVVPGTPPLLAQAVAAAMAKAPHDRPASAARLLALLEESIAGRPRSMPMSPRPRASRRTPAIRSTGSQPVITPPAGAAVAAQGRAKLAFALGVVAVALVAAAVAMRRGSRVDPTAVPSPKSVASASAAPRRTVKNLDALGDGGVELPPGAIGRLGRYFGSHWRMSVLAACDAVPRLVTADQSGGVRLWDAERGTRLRAWEIGGDLVAAELSADGETVVAAVRDTARPAAGGARAYVLWVLDGTSGRTRKVDAPAVTGRVALAPEGRHAAWFDASIGTVSVTPLLEGGRSALIPLANAQGAAALTLSRDGTMLAALAPTAVELWDVPGRARTRAIAFSELPLKGDLPRHVVLSADGAMLALVSKECVTSVPVRGGAPRRFEVPGAFDARFSRDARRLAMLGGRGLTVVDSATGEVRVRRGISSACALAGADVVYAAEEGKLARFGQARGWTDVQELRVHFVEPDAQRILVGLDGARAVVRDRATGRDTPIAAPMEGWIFDGLAPGGRSLYMSRRDRATSRNGVRVVELATGAHTEQWEDADAFASQVLPLGDGLRYLLIDSNGITSVDGARREPLDIRTESGAPASVIMAAIGSGSPGGGAFVGYEANIGEVLVDLATRTVRRIPGTGTLGGRGRGLPHVRWIGGDKTFIGEGGGGWVLHFERASLRELRRLRTARADMTALAVSKDEQWVAAAHVDGSLWLWHLPTGRLARQFVPGTGPVMGVGVSAAEGLVLSLDRDGVLTAWDVAFAAGAGDPR